MEQSYLSWKRSIEAKLDHEKRLEEEAKKIFQSGGRVTKSVTRDKKGNEKVVLVLQFGRYTPRIKISKKYLAKLGILVDEVAYRDNKKNMRKKRA